MSFEALGRAVRAPIGAALQRRRRLAQIGFFILFVLAPALDLLRFDLYETRLYLFGMPMSLGLDALIAGRTDGTHAAIRLMLGAFVPAIALVVGFVFVAWRYGRLYCGWLCPHFSAVEMLNGVLRRAFDRYSLWDRHPLPPRERGEAAPAPTRGQRAAWWVAFGALALLLAATWAVTLLTYLLPPAVIWSNLLHGTLTANQARFIGITTLLFIGEFVLARHLFCRFGCAVGLFQSLAWMSNPRGMVVAFDRPRARDCRTCDPPHGSACDNACPMRLNPRDIKRMMFSCVQCGRCMQACEGSQSPRGESPLLRWQHGDAAIGETVRRRRSEFAGVVEGAPGAAGGDTPGAGQVRRVIPIVAHRSMR